ncbi:MAG: hypothetical protein KatS3mg006_0317 [Pyrinomonadaceae bacterium]|nr:MAG: hypothetical protein KatS3mg006_0317 [Pyrinomonadaceae bacterium]
MDVIERAVATLTVSVAEFLGGKPNTAKAKPEPESQMQKLQEVKLFLKEKQLVKAKDVKNSCLFNLTALFFRAFILVNLVNLNDYHKAAKLQIVNISYFLITSFRVDILCLKWLVVYTDFPI